MKTEQPSIITLEKLPADRHLVDELFARQLISEEARQYAIYLLYPAKNWGLWVSRLLTVLGTSLILAEFLDLLVFNWTRITAAIKLGAIQIAILGCLGASFYCGIHKGPSGRIMLLIASVLLGVFLAVVDHVYQTGANEYSLFMIWSLLILPWTIISDFAVLWILWLFVTNIFLILWWLQAVAPSHDIKFLIVSDLMLFNGVFLGLREYLALENTKWVEAHWTRTILVLPVLIFALIPSIIFIFDPIRAHSSFSIGALFSAVIHLLLYAIYRFKLPDFGVLAATTLSGCIILEAVAFRSLSNIFHHSTAIFCLSMGAITLGVFSFTIAKLRSFAKEMRLPRE